MRRITEWPALGVCIWALLACACSGPKTDLEDGRAEWEAKIPANYVMVIAGTGFFSGKSYYVVADGSVRTCSIMSDVEQEPCSLRPDEAGTDPVIEMYGRALDAGDCKVKSVEIDPATSHLMEYYHDCGEEGFGESVTCFVEGSTDLDDCSGVEIGMGGSR